MNAIIIGKGNLGKAFYDYSLKHPDFKILDMIDESLQIKEYSNVDVIIDFSSPSALLTSLSLALKYKAMLVIGTTAYNSQQENLIKEKSQELRIVKDPNFSLGLHLLEYFKSILDKSGLIENEYVIEAHHKYKKDVPSGSSFLLSKEIKNIYSLRGGSLFGEHTLRVFLANEELELTHRIHSRLSFVLGVIKILPYLKNKANGIYSFNSFRKEIYGI